MTFVKHGEMTPAELTAEQNKQEALYQFPYHYIAHARMGSWQVSRALGWGFKQLAILTTVVRLVEEAQPRTFLDFGCGDGRLIAELRTRLRLERVVGVDYSERALTLAAAMIPSTNNGQPELLQDSRSIVGKFDVVTAVETLEHIPDDEIPAAIGELHRLLHDQGRLIVTVPTTNTPLNRKHFRHYNESILKAQTDDLFRIEHIQFVHRLGRLERIIRKLLHNAVFTLQFPPALRYLTGLYQRRVLEAAAHDGAHMVAVLSKVHG